jgi:tetratricopeptide (TPR) repeat protein
MNSQGILDDATASNRAGRLYSRAVALWSAGREQEAADALDAALREKDDFAEALSMGAYILSRRGKTETALRFYRRAVGCKPDLASAWSNMGKLLFQLDRFEEALAAFEAAQSMAPDDADVCNSRAGALRALGRLEQSAGAAGEALRRRPDFPEAALNLGTALLKLGRTEESLAAYRRASRARPNYADALCGAALALRALNRLDEARAAFEQAERLGSREAVSGKGCLDLSMGDFERGWDGYEARWIAGKSLAEALGTRFPTWSGPGRSGRSVLVLNDHGLGDTIQFSRYLPMMARAGVAATFVCPAKLHRLLDSRLGVRLVEKPPEGEAFDAQIPLSSLPRAFSTRLNNVPAPIGYLSAEPELQRRWAARIGESGFKIGVVWQGNPNPEADFARSIPLPLFASLGAAPNVRLISLQKGHGVEQLERLPPGMRVETLGEDFDAGTHAFVDAAAAIGLLDLVVTCDTSIAHLAGALGRPVWVALKKDAEWRWLRDRTDSPWYPTMRLFRQPEIGDWVAIFAEMADACTRLVRRRRASHRSAVGDLCGETAIGAQ